MKFSTFCLFVALSFVAGNVAARLDATPDDGAFYEWAKSANSVCVVETKPEQEATP